MRGLLLVLITLIPFCVKEFFEKREEEGCFFLNRCSDLPVFIFTEKCTFKGVMISDLSEVRCEDGKISVFELGGKEGLIFGKKMDLNETSLEDLMAIPGIGYKIAREIILLREKKGGFKSVDELIEVKGIGKKTLKKIRKFFK